MFNKVADYFKNSYAELTKVNWPTRSQIVNLTIIVIAFSLVLAGFIGAVDYGFSRVIQRVLFHG